MAEKKNIEDVLECLPQYVESVLKLSEQLEAEHERLLKYEKFGDEKLIEECKVTMEHTLNTLLKEVKIKNELVKQFFDYVRNEPNIDKLILIDKLIRCETWDDIAVKYKYSSSGIYNKRKKLYKKLKAKFLKE